MEAPTSFGRWLKELRRAHDLTQDELARRVGCALITIKKIEADERRPSRQIAERMLQILAIPPDEQLVFMHLARPTPPLVLRPALSRPITPPALDLDGLLGQTIKGYELRECLGSGGFGAVFRALQPSVGHEVAVKIILPQLADDPDFIRRFEVEAQTIARLEHPHIVPLYDYWREPGGAYLVMRYVRGGSLHTGVHGTSWPIERVTWLLEQVGSALQFAHQFGVVHRDIKPANVLLDTDGSAYLADFGIAKDLTAAHPDTPTQADVLVGSPVYLSPEQLRDEPVTSQTDIYSLGIVLYELLTGAHPFVGLPPAEQLARQLNDSLPSLTTVPAELAQALDTVIQRATAKRPTDRYPDMLHLLDDWWRAIGSKTATRRVTVQPRQVTNTQGLSAGDIPTLTDLAVLRDDRITDTDLARLENPYKGLRAFIEADAANFFGRTTLTERLLERMAEEHTQGRFLAVVGPSGSGKSSVVRAGLIPALRGGGLPGSENWFIVEIIPGAYPLEELEAALLRVAVNPPPSLLEQLQADERGLLRAIKRVLPADDTTELVLVIDQFEELFTLVRDETTRARILNSLLAAVTDPRSRLRLLITLRADFYDRPLLYSGFGELMRERTEVVLPLTPEELQEAIVGPAERVGLILEPGLVTTITKDVGEQPGTLPLLQYMLTELFEQREGRVLTQTAYQTSGGVLGALGRRADELYEGLDARGQEAVRQLFLRLVTLGEGVEDTRRRVRRAELASDIDVMESVIERYGRYRLLTFDRDPLTREPTVEVAHEALIRAWDRLSGWLDESRDDLRVQRRLAADASEWARSGQEVSFLASGAWLAQYETLAANDLVALNVEEQQFLHASVAERERRDAAERATQAALRENLARSEALWLAAEANRLLQAGGNVELIALLSIRSMRSRYTPQGDEALAGAAMLDYPVQWFRGHDSRIYAVAYAPDGRTVLTGSQDATARLWDVATGACLRIFSGHTNIVASVAFSPDGRTVLTGSQDATARLWDVATGAEIRRLVGHTSTVSGVAFSANNKQIATGSADSTARLWDAQTGELRCVIEHSSRVRVVAFSPKGRQILTSDDSGVVFLWDVETGEAIRTFEGHTDHLYGVVFSRDGRYVLTGGTDKTARLWDVQTGECLRVLAGHTDLIRAVAYAPDGQTVMTGGSDSTARLWDVETGAELRRFIGHSSFVFGVDYSPDSRYVLIGSADHTARLWNLQPVTGLPRFVGHTDQVVGVAFSPDGRYVLTGSDDCTLRLWDAQTGAHIRTFTGHTHPIGIGSVAFSPDGTRIFSGSNDKTARLWNVQTGEILRVFTHQTGFFWRVTFSTDGRYVLIGNNDRTARLWDIESGETVRVFAGHADQVVGVACSHDGRYVLTGSDDRTARLWDAETGEELQRFTDPHGPILGVAFSPNDVCILTGSADGLVRLWDVASGTELRRFAGHTGHVWSVAFSPDGRYALSASIDTTARLWDVASGAELRRFAGHTGTVLDAAFSPNGRYVLTGSADSTARLWDADYHDTIAYLCSRLLRNFTDNERAQYGINDSTPTCP